VADFVKRYTRYRRFNNDSVIVLQAADIFRHLRVYHSHHVSGLALYSTTLWHLQDSIGLSTLAHDLVDLDSLSPEVSAISNIGNVFF